MPKVSIIVNCYNGEQYLQETLQTIKNQSYDDYEVVFIDNCSDDNSPVIAKEFRDKLKYYRTSKLISLGAARNYAIKRCNGELIAFLDCDDLWEPDKLNTQVKLMDENQNCVMTMSNYCMLNMIDNTKKMAIKKNIKRQLNLSEFLIDYKYEMSSFMIRKKIIDDNNLMFDERLSYAEEYDFFARMASYGDVIYIPEVLARYRVHENMNSKKLKETIPFEYEIVLNNLLDCYTNVEKDFPEVVDYLKFLKDYTQTKIYIENKKNKEARKLIKPYCKRYKKAKLFYVFSFFPSDISYRMYKIYYSHKVV